MSTSTEKNTKAAQAANPVPHQGDHDRVQMLSLKADGTPDQHNPEIIGDPETAKVAAREQFAQQAVSAADVAANQPGSVTLVGQEDGSTEAIPATTDATDATEVAKAAALEVAEKAKAAADAAVEALHKKA